MSEFVHIHNHTHYSLLDGACTPAQLAKAAAEYEHRAVAITDHGVMFGAYEFYKKVSGYKIKPILGCEVYVANGSRFDKSAGKAGSKKRNYFHLVLLAKDEQGYRNLIKLTSLAHTEGFYYKPRIDRELLKQYHQGIIATSACIGGVVGSHLVNNDYAQAREAAEWYSNVFGDDFYLEVQNHSLEPDTIILEDVPKLAQDLGIKIVATNDCHYIKPDHAIAHNVLLHIKDVSASTVNLPDVLKLRYGTPEYYYKSTQQMQDLLGHISGAIENTVEIAEKCSFSFGKKIYMPDFPIPTTSSAHDLNEYLIELTYQGLFKRFGVPSKAEIAQDVIDRVDFELQVIIKMGFPGYFLIVQDFIAAARARGISVGPGRGSAAGSMVAYALGITNVDPMKYDLLFERFLNPDRVSMPDIDIDFNDEKREQVIEYVREKYGSESVAQIITFGTLSSRAVLKDVARVLGIPLATVDSITKHIPVILGKVMPVKDALALAELRWVKESDDPKIKQLIEYSMVLEGFARNSSIHAAGVVIAPGSVDQYVPLYKADSGLATQFNMKDLEDAGLLKMDFLGLRTLSIIDNTVEMIRHNHGVVIDVDALDLFDEKTYTMLGQGKTLAVFQFESEPMQKYLKMLKPTSLEDLTAMNALYRPGPMDNIPEFIERKQGRKKIEYLDHAMDPALKATYGIIVYQEQVMQLVRDIAGFTLAQADMMRRAMGKKDAKLMAEQKGLFIDGAVKKGFDENIAGEMFDLIEKFASYGFNKSHSLAYSYLAYQTAWLKAHYPAEFLAANMTAELSDQDKIVKLIDEAKTFGIEVLPPDVNQSLTKFSVVGSHIRFGMAGIKGVGENAVDEIVFARKQKPFTSLFDFVKRVNAKVVNRRTLEALVCAGAFDAIYQPLLPKKGHRAQLFDAIDSALGFAQATGRADDNGMDTLFGGTADAEIAEPALPSTLPWSSMERLRREKEYLNFYISGHPLESLRPHVLSLSTLTLDQKEHPSIGKIIRVSGIISGIRTKLDKNERQMAFVQIEDFGGKAEIILWARTYETYKEFIQPEAMIMAMGKSELNGSDSIKVIADQILPLTDTPAQFAKGLRISVQRDAIDPILIEKASQLSAEYPGKFNMYFSVYDSAGALQKRYHASQRKIALSDESIQDFARLFGIRNLSFTLD